MVGSCFGRRLWLRALLIALPASVGLPHGRAWAQTAATSSVPGATEVPDLPSKAATPPRPRLASHQPLGSGEGPLPPGLSNPARDLDQFRPARNSMPPALPGMTGLKGDEVVVQVVINPPLKHNSEQSVRRLIKTIADRPFDVRTIEEDVKRLEKSRLFWGVRVEYQRVGQRDIVVIFHMTETPTIKYLRFFGQERIKERHLKKQSGLKEGGTMDAFAVKDGASKVQDYYHEKGFNKATVKVLEGTGKDDRGVVYLVNEGQKQKVWNVEFEGNVIASDSRLKTMIQSKPPLLYLFKGEVEGQKIEEDVRRLAFYYRDLGFFKANIGRELVWNEDQNWLTIRFIIDEGPRYKVRNVAFVGQRIFTPEQLSEKLKLKAGDYFDKGKLDRDQEVIKDKYGVKGYVYADIQQDPKFSPNPDEAVLDLVYQIEEGKPCVVSRVDVKIVGDNPHTRRNTILNRVSLHPGDPLSTREIRDSVRRLKSSTLFKTTPGNEPRINYDRPDLDDAAMGIAERPSRPGGFRGQSPDPPRREAR